MYEIKKRDFYPKEKYHKDKRYLIDIFRKLGAIETEESFLLPDEVLIPLKDSSIPDEVYDYFQLVWSNEECTIDIEDVVGSHDYRNLEYDNWLKNFLINDVGSHILEKYLEDPKSVFDNPNHTFSAFEINGKFYVADGHHRFSTLYLHYHILKSQNKIPDNFPKKIKGIKRVVPTNLEFVKRFVAFCVANNLYNYLKFDCHDALKANPNPTNDDIKNLLDGKFVLPSKLDLTSYVKEIQTTKEETKTKKSIFVPEPIVSVLKALHLDFGKVKTEESTTGKRR